MLAAGASWHWRRVLIEFAKPRIGEKALAYVKESLDSRNISGDGPFTTRCHQWLKTEFGSPALLTHSGTGALEMSALLAEVGAGDEVILPSFTFSSTANAFVLRGAMPVFVDVRPDTLNLDETLLDQALSARTKAVVAVHYAGVACEMDVITAFAAANRLIVIEDAAQAHLSRYRGKPAGSIGALGCLSFHASKNLVSGEGGALILNAPQFVERAYVIREKGTNRTAFMNRKVDKYEWLDVGSSYLLSDLLAALLLAQLEDAQSITQRRISVWCQYQDAFASAEGDGLIMRPHPPVHTPPNGHIYYILANTPAMARSLRTGLNRAGVPSNSHYVPLHSSPAGLKFGRTATAMPVTNRIAETIVRLPIHSELSDDTVARIVSIVYDVLSAI